MKRFNLARITFRRGATLVEAMTALAVFSIGILGILQMNIVASRQNAAARRVSSATSIARDLVDAFERLPFQHSALTLGRHTLATASPSERIFFSGAAQTAVTEGEAPGVEGSTYDVSWNVDDAPSVDGGIELSAEQLGAKWIQVVVEVRMPAGGRRRFEQWTVKHDPQRVTGSANAGQEI